MFIDFRERKEGRREREREKERERERETSMCEANIDQLPPIRALTRD